jgi:Tfp pilus assembly protein PilE
MIQIVILVILGGVVYAAYIKSNKKRSEDIESTNLDIILQAYEKYFDMGLTERDMIDKCYVLESSIHELRKNGLIN